MNGMKRITGGSVAAIGVTYGLGVLMAAMIAVEFAPIEKTKSARFEIYPAIEEPEPLKPREKLNQLKRVEVPPAPPKTGFMPTGPVSVGPNSVIGDKGIYKLPRTIFNISPISVSDTNAAPISRPAPTMPPRAEKSGHCKVIFDVTPEGSPFNIQTPYCSDSIFKMATVRAVQKWRFAPKRKDGRFVTMTGVRNQIIFRLTDERGNLIPE